MTDSPASTATHRVCHRCRLPLNVHRLDASYRVCDDGADADSIAVYPLPVRGAGATTILPLLMDDDDGASRRLFQATLRQEMYRTCQWLQEVLVLGRNRGDLYYAPTFTYRCLRAALTALEKISL